MDCPTASAHSGSMTNTQSLPDVASAQASDRQQARRIERVLARRSFCVVASTSSSGASHAAGVLYEYVDGALYAHTMRTSRKARNITADPRVGVVIPTRRLPVGPPFNLQFQARADLLAIDSPPIADLLESRKLRSISGHGALDEPDGCFIRIVPTATMHSYGIGVRVRDVIRDPLHSGNRHLPWPC